MSSCPEDASDSDFSASPSPKPKTKGRKSVEPRKVQPKNTASVVKTTGSMKGGVASTGSKQPMHRGMRNKVWGMRYEVWDMEMGILDETWGSLMGTRDAFL